VLQNFTSSVRRSIFLTFGSGEECLLVSGVEFAVGMLGVGARFFDLVHSEDVGL